MTMNKRATDIKKEVIIEVQKSIGIRELFM